MDERRRPPTTAEIALTGAVLGGLWSAYWASLGVWLAASLCPRQAR